MRHGVLDAVALQRRAQQLVELSFRHGAGVGSRWTDDEDELAARFQRPRIVRQLGDRRARDLLVQFGEFAADRGLARAHDFGEIRERVLDTVAGFEQDQGRIDAREFGQSRAPRPLLRGQKTLEVEAIGR